MTITQLLLIIFFVLLCGLALPLSYGKRMALFLALVVVAVLTFLGGGVQYFLGLFH